MGTRWTSISQQLKGRSENTVKNRWNSIIRRRNFNTSTFQSQVLGKLLMNAKRSVSNKKAAAMKNARGTDNTSDREGDGTTSGMENSEDVTGGLLFTRGRTRGKRNRRYLEDDASDDEFVLPGGSGTVVAPRRSNRALAKQTMKYGSDENDYATTDEEEEEKTYSESARENAGEADYRAHRIGRGTRPTTSDAAYSSTAKTPDNTKESASMTTSTLPHVQFATAKIQHGNQTSKDSADFRPSDTAFVQENQLSSMQIPYPGLQQTIDSDRFSHNHSPTGGEPIGFTNQFQGNHKPLMHHDGPIPHGFPHQPMDSKYESRHMHPGTDRNYMNMYGAPPQHRPTMYSSTFLTGGSNSHDAPVPSLPEKSTFSDAGRGDFSPSLDSMLNPPQSRYVPGRDHMHYRSEYGILPPGQNPELSAMPFPSRSDTPGSGAPPDWNGEPAHIPPMSSAMGYPNPYLGGGYHGPKHPYPMKHMHFPPQGAPTVAPDALGNPNMYGMDEMFPPSASSLPHAPYLGMYPSGYPPHPLRSMHPLGRHGPPKSSGDLYPYMNTMSTAHTPQRPLSRTSSQTSTTLPGPFSSATIHQHEHTGNSYKLGEMAASTDYLKDRPFGLHSYANFSRHSSPLSSRIPSPTGSPPRGSNASTYASPITDNFRNASQDAHSAAPSDTSQSLSNKEPNTSTSSTTDGRPSKPSGLAIHTKIDLENSVPTDSGEKISQDRSAQDPALYSSLSAPNFHNFSPPVVHTSMSYPPSDLKPIPSPYYHTGMSSSYTDSPFPASDDILTGKHKAGSLFLGANPAAPVPQASLNGKGIHDSENKDSKSPTLGAHSVLSPVSSGEVSSPPVASSESQKTLPMSSMLLPTDSAGSVGVESDKQVGPSLLVAASEGAASATPEPLTTLAEVSECDKQPSEPSSAADPNAKPKMGEPLPVIGKPSSRPNVDLNLLPSGPFDQNPRWPTALEPSGMMNPFISAYSPLSANTPISFSRPTSPPAIAKPDKPPRGPQMPPPPGGLPGYHRSAFAYGPVSSPNIDEPFPGLEQPYHLAVSPALGMVDGFPMMSHPHMGVEMRDPHRPHGATFGFVPYSIERAVSPYHPTQPHPYSHYMHGQGMYRYHPGVANPHHPMYHPHSKLSSGFLDPNYDFDRYGHPMKGSSLDFHYSRAPSPGLLAPLEQNPHRAESATTDKSDAPDSCNTLSAPTNPIIASDVQMPVPQAFGTGGSLAPAEPTASRNDPTMDIPAPTDTSS